MKNNYFTTALLTIFCGAVFAQEWNYLGSPKFSAGNVVGQIDIKTLSDGTPIVGLAQSNYNPPYIGGAVVRKFDGTNWVNLGNNPLVTQNPDEVKLAVGQDDKLYAAAIFGPYIEVFYLNGTTWDNIGTVTNAYSGSYNEISLEVSPSNELYLVYTQSSPGLAQPVCKKYNGSTWSFVGGTEGIIIEQPTDATAISFDSSGTPYVLTAETNNAGRLKLYRYNSGSNEWQLQSGTNVISGNDVIKANLKVVSANEIYIGAIGRFGNPFNFRPGVVHYDGTDFNWLDSLNAPDLTANNTRMDMHYHSGDLYRAYDKGYSTGGIQFEKYNVNSGWELVGTNLSDYPDNYSNQTATIAFSGNVPLIAFTEPINMPDVRSSVISFGDVVIDPTATIEDLELNHVFIYPSIFHDELYIHSESIESIIIYDLGGKKVYESSLKNQNSANIGTENWMNGLYIAYFRLINGEQKSQKLIKQ